jgi:glucosamine--fructose-6-phosphate aminotransferase (isomerizing)
MGSIAVLMPAAGKSTRFNDKEKKPFATLDGRAVWLRTAELFVNRNDVAECLLIISADDEERFRTRYAANLAFMNVKLVHGGRERSVAATKTFTGQILLFYMLAAALAEDGRTIDYQTIPDLAERALEQKPAIVELVQRYVFMENCVVVGRGLAYANAYEFALKLMETCYVVAERFSSADFLHGPVAMIERHFPVILFAPPGVMLAGTKDLIQRLHELRADTLAITGDLDAAAKCSRSIIMPREIDEFLAPIPYIIPAQLFAALLAEAKGLDPDAPRSLSKVTRTL